MKKITLILLLFMGIITGYAQVPAVEIAGGGLDGSTYQKTVLISNTTLGFLIEAAQKPDGSKLPIELNWRGFGGNSTPPFKISPDGNVGIGTTTPLVPLAVERSQNASTSMWVRNNNNAADANSSISSIAQNQRLLISANSDSYMRPYPGFHPGSTLLYSNAMNGLNIISTITYHPRRQVLIPV